MKGDVESENEGTREGTTARRARRGFSLSSRVVTLASHAPREDRTRHVRPGASSSACLLLLLLALAAARATRATRPSSSRVAPPRHELAPGEPFHFVRFVLVARAHAPPPPTRRHRTKRNAQEEDDATEKFSLELETKQLGELQESRDELLSRVSNLKQDLQDWRFKLDNQVKAYRGELGDLRKTLNSEVAQLRDEFQDLRATLRQQLEATAAIANDPAEAHADE